MILVAFNSYCSLVLIYKTGPRCSLLQLQLPRAFFFCLVKGVGLELVLRLGCRLGFGLRVFGPEVK